jgi:hypothetical protein
VTRKTLAFDDWPKEVSPRDALRRWFNHDPARWPEVVARYGDELEAPPAREAIDELARHAREEPLTLVYAASDEQRYSPFPRVQWRAGATAASEWSASSRRRTSWPSPLAAAKDGAPVL